MSLGLLAAPCGEWDQAGRIHPGKVTHIAGAACGRLLWLQVIAPCSLRMRDPAVENSVEAFYLVKAVLLSSLVKPELWLSVAPQAWVQPEFPLSYGKQDGLWLSCCLLSEGKGQPTLIYFFPGCNPAAILI